MYVKELMKVLKKMPQDLYIDMLSDGDIILCTKDTVFEYDPYDCLDRIEKGMPIRLSHKYKID